MKLINIHTSREEWLRAATKELRKHFEKLGHKLPEKMRFAIAFPSTGKRGRSPGEVWHPENSDDQSYEIIIRADMYDPVEVLSILVHELVHTLLPLNVKHGKEFRKIAHQVGLEGQMRQTVPTPLLRDHLQSIAKNLGELPHARLRFEGVSDGARKKTARYLKAECPVCGYHFRITAKWAQHGMYLCKINPEHGELVCELPNHTDDDADANNTAAHSDTGVAKPEPTIPAELPTTPA